MSFGWRRCWRRVPGKEPLQRLPFRDPVDQRQRNKMERAIPSNEATPNRRVGQIRAVALHAALSAGFCLWPADYGAALRIDQAGDVLIAGSSYGGRNLDFYLASYAREDGTLRWEM